MTASTDGARIAMWSGPRNISTALLRSWGNRADTVVCDEPFYAHYLRHRPDVDHPGRAEVLASQPTAWREVAAWLTGPVPEGKAIFYQKHMAHHLLPDMVGEWLGALRHAFLIRDPREMLLSLSQVMAEPTLADTGLPQQCDLWQRLGDATGAAPPVIDARDVLENPEGTLRRLCVALGVAWDGAMLAWPPGPRPTDGVWAKHWYASVERSMGFQPYAPNPAPLPARFQPLYEACLPFYDQLHARRLTSDE